MSLAAQDAGRSNNTEQSPEPAIKSDENVNENAITYDEAEDYTGLPPTAEQLRLQRYGKMMKRAGFTPDKHVEHLARVQKKEGSDSVKLGAVSGQQYKDIFKSRAFDQYFFQIPPKKSSLEMLSKVAQKILSKDPVAEEEHRKGEEEEAKLGGGNYAGTSKQSNLKERASRHPIGFKEDLFGPPGLAPPQKNIPNSEGREKYFGYDGGWLDGKMHGYGTYRFADGMTYEGVMRDNWPSGGGTACYSNGGMYVGRWKDGKYEGFGKLTCPEGGTVYEGGWHEGQRSGHGTLKFKSGSKYKGDFLLGVYHGRGLFKSANLNVSYDGWWSSGFICGHGTLTMPDGTTTVRSWPQQSRFGGGLSLRGAMEIVEMETEKARLDKIDEKQALYGVTELVELQFRVQNIRREVSERRYIEKAEDRAEAAAKRKAAKLAMMEAKLKALFDKEKEEEPDDIEKEFMT